ncbi:MAG: fold, partial [Thermoleophilaceae bacterium]|nr:fold [Thermoleophilaceae bacterium]
MQDSQVAGRAHQRRRDDAPEAVALATAARRAAALVRFSPDPVIGFTSDGVITEWNPAAERLYGHTEQEALGQ